MPAKGLRSGALCAGAILLFASFAGPSAAQQPGARPPVPQQPAAAPPAAPVAPKPQAAAELGAPDTVEQGARFKVKIAGPNADGDRIHLAWPGMATGSFINSVLATADRPEREFTAPGDLGLYELRYFHAESGEVIARRPLRVVVAEFALSVTAKVVQGTNVVVTFKGRSGVGDEIRLAAVDAPPGTALASIAPGSDKGTVTLEAPIDPGRYEIRYVSGSEKTILVRRPVEVVSVPVTIQAPDSVAAGAEFEVAWKGPGGRLDDIGVFKAAAGAGEHVDTARVWSDDRPIRLNAPVEAGSYELRYLAGGRKILARRPIRVTDAGVSLEAAAEIGVGKTIEIGWNGPGATFDEIEIARVGMAAGDHLSSVRIDQGKRVSLVAPPLPGRYEIRYWSSHTGTVLQRRALAVTGPEVRLSILGTVKAGGSFLVSLAPRVPGGTELRIAQPWFGPTESLATIAIPSGDRPISLTAPDKAGTYVLRYYAPEGEVILAATAFKVE